MKRLAAGAAVFLFASFAAFAAEGNSPPSAPVELPSAPTLHLESPPRIASALVEELVARNVAVVSGDTSAGFDARIVLRPSTLARVRTTSAGSPASGETTVQRAELLLLDPSTGCMLFRGNVSVPADSPEALAVPLAERIAQETERVEPSPPEGP